MPARRRAVGLQELGLPYAADAAVTRHLARFLDAQAAGGPSAAVDPARAERTRLSNARAVQRRRDEGRGRCARGSSSAEPLAGAGGVRSARCDARARRAGSRSRRRARRGVHYGRVRASERGVRIRSGASRSYYVGIESAHAGGARFHRARSRRCASCRSAWRKARAPRSRAASSAWPSASRPNSASSLDDPQERSGRRDRSKTGATISRSSARSRSRWTPAAGREHDDLRAGHARKPRDRNRHARAVVQGAGRRAAVEARAEHPRIERDSRRDPSVPHPVPRRDSILGTTNSAVAFVDTRRRAVPACSCFRIPQLTEPSSSKRGPAAVVPLFRRASRDRERHAGAAVEPDARSDCRRAGPRAGRAGAGAPGRRRRSRGSPIRASIGARPSCRGASSRVRASRRSTRRRGT